MAVGLAWALLPLSSPLAFKAPNNKDLPASITVAGKSVELKDLSNPLSKESESHEKNLKAGGKLYFKHCFLCHGDLMDGTGLFGDRFSPPPANFHKSIKQGKTENYFFWRIMKGAQGLAVGNQPWESAMPAWEDKLSQKEAWQVTLFIFENVKHPTVPNPPAKPSVKRGKQVYLKKCVFCHAEDGSGKGVSEFYSSPRPRNFVKGQYKFRTTPFGKIPTDDDLYQMLIRGMPNTTMPSWKHFPKVDLDSLVLYLKTLSKKFDKFKKKGKSHKLIKVKKQPKFDKKGLNRGKELFAKACSGCHGLAGRGDGESTLRNVDIESDAIRPRNLSKPWTFRRGSTAKDLFLSIRTGLSTTAMPRHSKRIYKDKDIWDIVNYVTTLFNSKKKPKVATRLKAVKSKGELPLDPADAGWKSAPSFYIPLGGQILQSRKKYYPTVDSVQVQALYNGDEIAIRLAWDDPTFDPILKTTAKVVESPPPPLPPELQAHEEEEDDDHDKDEDGKHEEGPEAQKIPDSIAIQFPVSSEPSVLPYFLNGDKDHPVNLWKWASGSNKTTEWKAQGLQDQSQHAADSQQVKSQVAFSYGQYQLVMKRKLSTSDTTNDTQFEPGKKTSIAINAWDGNVRESGSQKAISSWYSLSLE